MLSGVPHVHREFDWSVIQIAILIRLFLNQHYYADHAIQRMCNADQIIFSIVSLNGSYPEACVITVLPKKGFLLWYRIWNYNLTATIYFQNMIYYPIWLISLWKLGVVHRISRLFLRSEGMRSSPEVAYWASDHWFLVYRAGAVVPR